jgi:hypothetical protein
VVGLWSCSRGRDEPAGTEAENSRNWECKVDGVSLKMTGTVEVVLLLGLRMPELELGGLRRAARRVSWASVRGRVVG